MPQSSTDSAQSLQIVVPCYNEEEVLPTTVEQLREVLAELQQRSLVSAESSILFIDDGSSDQTWQLISSYAQNHVNVAGIRLTQNAGHQAALLAGLERSTAELTISIDADLQDDLAAIYEMVEKASDGCDVVFGVRGDRSSDTRFKRLTAEGFYKVLSLLGVDVIHNHADFRLMNRKAINRLMQYGEANLYLRGVVPKIGHQTDSVYFTRRERAAGESKYPLHKMIALAVNGITSFSAVPLRLIAALGLIVFLVSFGMGLWVLWVRVFTDTAIPGWASTILPTVFLGGIQLLSLGVIGEYIAKIYLETKRRPKYFIETYTSGEERRSGQLRRGSD